MADFFTVGFDRDAQYLAIVGDACVADDGLIRRVDQQYPAGHAHAHARAFARRRVGRWRTWRRRRSRWRRLDARRFRRCASRRILGREPVLHAERIDIALESAHVVAQEIPGVVIGIGVGQALAGRLQALPRDLVEIGRKALAEIALLPYDEAGDDGHAEHGEGEKQTMPQTQAH